MKVIIRKAIKSDAAAILSLIEELAVFEKEPEAVIISQAQIEKDGFGDRPLFECRVAEADKKVVGMALYYPSYSTWKGPAIHLEDLIVTKKHRGKGIGFSLFSRFIEYSYKLKAKRVQWVVLDWNKDAIDFYIKNGAQVLDDWRVALMDEKAIKKFLDK